MLFQVRQFKAPEVVDKKSHSWAPRVFFFWRLSSFQQCWKFPEFLHSPAGESPACSTQHKLGYQNPQGIRPAQLTVYTGMTLEVV